MTTGVVSQGSRRRGWNSVHIGRRRAALLPVRGRRGKIKSGGGRYTTRRFISPRVISFAPGGAPPPQKKGQELPPPAPTQQPAASLPQPPPSAHPPATAVLC